MVNLASPIVGVPFPIFLTALLAGHLPINFISVKVRPHPQPGQPRFGSRRSVLQQRDGRDP